MRVGAWNLDGRWSSSHLALLREIRCDILMLTEVPYSTEIAGMTGHRTELDMVPHRRSWAGVWSQQPMTPLPDPHGATAMVEIDGLKVCSSVLPWRNSGGSAPWRGANTGERMIAAVADVACAAPDIWGGDWNQELVGSLHTGTRIGRSRIADALRELGLKAPTVDAPAGMEDARSIDHVAVPSGWETRVEHHSAALDKGRLSDHDAYVVEAVRP